MPGFERPDLPPRYLAARPDTARTDFIGRVEHTLNPHGEPRERPNAIVNDDAGMRGSHLELETERGFP